MAKLPRIAGGQAIAALNKIGFRRVRGDGSHQQLARNGHPGVVTVPIHSGETLNPKTLKSILRQAGHTVDEFIKLL